MKPTDLGSLFDELVDRGVRTPVELDRPLDIAPDFGASYTPADVAGLVRNAAGWLHGAGVVPGDRVAVVKENHWDYVLLAAAAARLGAVPALLSDRLAPEVLRVLLGRLDAALLVTTSAVLDTAPDLLGAARRVLVLDGRRVGALDLDALRGTRPPGFVRRHADVPLAIAHTAGTTGTPKLVVHTGDSLMRLAARQSRRVPVLSPGRDDTAASAIAYCDVRAIPWTAGALWRGPRGLVVSGSGSADVLRAHPPTTVDALPSVYLRWESTADAGLFADVRIFTSTGDAVHPPTARAFLSASRRARPVWVQTWGQAETGPLTHRLITRATVAEPGARHPSTVGRPVPGRTRVRVVDPETGRRLPAGRAGLLQVRTSALGAAYVGEDERWAAKESGHWWHTGDVGVRTRTGAYRLLDREVDVLPGQSCLELEDVLADRLPGVLECAVLPVRGRVPVPVVVVRDGRLDPAAWGTAARDLPAMANPVVLPADSLPRTATGVIRRGDLRALLRLGAGYGGGGWS
ncbi:AMP-binding protein [Actinokineospora guangxiensis]|uniref:AMP-binding protein n=1 Tax=Actinokineospora guangxiensis TaxID=1490288 RepID=A0ABW0EVK2_9PSEU